MGLLLTNVWRLCFLFGILPLHRKTKSVEPYRYLFLNIFGTSLTMVIAFTVLLHRKDFNWNRCAKKEIWIQELIALN
jgi:hypothetical protein